MQGLLLSTLAKTIRNGTELSILINDTHLIAHIALIGCCIQIQKHTGKWLKMH